MSKCKESQRNHVHRMKLFFKGMIFIFDIHFFCRLFFFFDLRFFGMLFFHIYFIHVFFLFISILVGISLYFYSIFRRFLLISCHFISFHFAMYFFFRRSRQKFTMTIRMNLLHRNRAFDLTIQCRAIKVPESFH